MRTVNSASGVDPVVITEVPEVGVVTGVTGTELPKTDFLGKHKSELFYWMALLADTPEIAANNYDM